MTRTWSDVVPVDGDVAVPVGGGLLVVEAEGVEELVGGDPWADTPGAEVEDLAALPSADVAPAAGPVPPHRQPRLVSSPVRPEPEAGALLDGCRRPLDHRPLVLL